VPTDVTVTATATATATEEPTVPTEEPTETLTPSPTLPACCDILEDGGFEDTGSTAWHWGGLAERVDGTSNPLPHAGIYEAWLGGYDNAADQIYQELTIPSGVISATMSYWWAMETRELDHPHDYFYAEVYDSEGTLLETLETRDDGDIAGANWQFSSGFDLLAHAGESIRISFRVVNDGTNFTSFYVDDVVLQVCGGGYCEPTVTPTVATTWTPTPEGYHSILVPLIIKGS
jgi:hypothetical protein